MKNNLTVIILSKNEEAMIAEAIESATFADEVMVIDSQSTDNTPSIAKKLGARVLVHPFENYAEQRNFALKHIAYEWVLYLDADERITPALKKRIKQIISDDHISYTAYRIARKNFYLGKNPWPDIEYLERLFYVDALKQWKGAVHEHAEFEGNCGTVEEYIKHYTHRDLSSMVEKTLVWADVEATMMQEAHHPPMNGLRFLRVMATKFWGSYVKQNGWKAGTVGLIESIYQAFSYFIIYAVLWEKQSKKR